MNNDIDTSMRLCPYCAEEVKSAAIKCKHCGSEIAKSLGGQDTTHPTERQTPNNLAPGDDVKTVCEKPKKRRNALVVSITVLVFLIVITAVGATLLFEDVVGSIDRSTESGAAEAFCAAIQHPRTEVIEAALGSDFFDMSSSKCNLTRRCMDSSDGDPNRAYLNLATGRCKGGPREYEECNVGVLREKFVAFSKAMAETGSDCTCIRTGYERFQDYLTCTTYRGTRDEVRFVQTSEGWRPAPKGVVPPLFKANRARALDALSASIESE